MTLKTQPRFPFVRIGLTLSAVVDPSPSHRRIVRLARIFLLLCLLGNVYRGYWVYSAADHAGALGPYLDFVHGTGPAPFQYRAAPFFFAAWFYKHFHWPFRYGLTLLDAVSSVIAVLGGYQLLLNRRLAQRLGIASAAYAALALFLLTWQDFYKKPETDVAAALTVVLLAAWTASSRQSSRFSPLRALAILVAVVALSTVRADIALSMNLGLLAVFTFRPGTGIPFSRSWSLALAAASCVAAAVVQEALMRVIFPHAAPYAGPVVMLPYDIGNPAHVLICAAYVIPSLWTLKEAWARKDRAVTASLGFAAGAVIFIALWAILGRLEEVRIFLPVGLAICPLAAEMAARAFSEPSN